MDTPRGRDDPTLDERPTPRLIEGRFASIEDKVSWMLAGRDRRTGPDGRPEDSVDDALRRPETLETARTLLAGWSDRDVGVYVATSVRDRPWLSVLRADHSPEIWRTVVCLDRSGHGLSRHGPFGDSDLHLRRVMRLEDPAQPDPLLRERGIDGVNGRDHYCAERQTRFTTVEATALSYLNGLRDPRVRRALEHDDGRPPADVDIPIAELLDEDGNRHCAGFQLVGDVHEAKAARKDWAKQRREWVREHGDATGFNAHPPPVEAIPDFEGGNVIFRFARDSTARGYLITSQYPNPRDKEITI